MSQIRAIVFRLRAAIVLVAVAAVFGGALLSTPAARAAYAPNGLSIPCDHHQAIAGKDVAPVKRAGYAGHCPDCCLFGGVGVMALPARASFVIQPSAETSSLAVYDVTGPRAAKLLLSGAANGARAPPVSI
jgi:hypothetical protein